MPYRIGTSKQTDQNKTLVTIEGPGIEQQGFKLQFPSIKDGEAFIVGLNFAFAHGFRAALGLPGCPECDRLWDEYVKASEEHVKLIEQKLAANEMPPESGKALESKIEAASLLRLQVRASQAARIPEPCFGDTLLIANPTWIAQRGGSFAVIRRTQTAHRASASRSMS
jgi:hypothetical protein